VAELSAGLWVLCGVHARLCALPLESVIETMRPLPLQPLTGMPGFVIGLSIVRGEPIPVVDAGALLGSIDEARPTRFVTLRAGQRRVVLAVSAVIGVRALPSVELHPLPPLLAAISGDIVSSIGTLDAALLVVLRAARLVPDAAWDALDANRDGP
jgi:purine-binding chemotaxis protein CheW